MTQQQFVDELDDVKPIPQATAPQQTTADGQYKPAPQPPSQIQEPTQSSPSPSPNKHSIVVDDLDDKPTRPAATQAAEKETPQEDLGVDWDDEKAMKIPGALPRCRPAEKGKIVRFAILPPEAMPRLGIKEPVAPKAQRAKNHFVKAGNKELTGTYRCLTPIDATSQLLCCVKLGEDGELHFVALVVRYTSASSKDGSFEKGQPIDWEIQYVDLTHANFRAINFLCEEIEDEQGNTVKQKVYDMDLGMMHSPDRAFGYTFKRISSRPMWTRNEQFKAEVIEAAKKFMDGKKLQQRLGKLMTNLDWKSLLQKLSGGAQEATMENIEDV